MSDRREASDERSRLGVTVAVVGFLGVALAAIIYGSMGIHEYNVEICITFRGRTSCGEAAAANREDALRHAATNACASISGGVTDSIACSRTTPDSVRWLSE